MGDGDAMQLLRNRIKKGIWDGQSSLRPKIWPKLGELADFRYHEYLTATEHCKKIHTARSAVFGFS